MLSLNPYLIQNIELKNRIVMPPMCMYSAVNGFVQPFHLTHYGSRAVGGVGMVIVEATAVGVVAERDDLFELVERLGEVFPDAGPHGQDVVVEARKLLHELDARMHALSLPRLQPKRPEM